jgi:hypothetical protein
MKVEYVMEQYVKPWVVEKFKEAELIDEKEIIFYAAFGAHRSAGSIIGGAVKVAFTGLLFGYSSINMDFGEFMYMSIEGEFLHILPRLNKKKTKMEILEQKITFCKSDVEGVCIDGRFLYIQVDGQLFFINARKKFRILFYDKILTMLQ